MRKQLHYVTLFLLFFITKPLLADSYVDQYINAYKDIAIREMRRSGIPASITLAQGIHESSWGKGKLAVNSNNHFGIKCKNYWKGDSFYYEDDDYDKRGNLIKSCFRAYETPERSYIDHTNFLMTTAHYQELFGYSNTDYQRWAKGLKKCGYATDKEYANKLIRTIKKYQLDRFDLQVEQRVLSETLRYNSPKKKINNLMIKPDKIETTEFIVVNVPPAFLIPDDYKRRPKTKENLRAENYETAQKVESDYVVIKEILPAQYERQDYKIDRQRTTNEEPPKPIKEKSKTSNMKKQSIIHSGFASTTKAHHLARKPRVSNPNLR